MGKIKSFIFLSVSLMTLWLLLVGNLSQDEIITGAIVSVVITFMFFGTTLFTEMNLSIKSIIYVPIFFVVFTLALIKSNIDVALRVINPKLPIKPGIVKVRTKLKSKMGRITLANSITLTPGTLTVDVKDDVFYIHWINVRGQNIDEASDRLVKDFEKYLEVIFG